MKHMRYTCNKKNEPVFKQDCMKCSEYNPCAKDGKWCFAGALVIENECIMAGCASGAIVDAAMPVMTKHDYRDIKIAENTIVTIDLEEIKEKLHRDLTPNLLQYGE